MPIFWDGTAKLVALGAQRLQLHVIDDTVRQEPNCASDHEAYAVGNGVFWLNAAMHADASNSLEEVSARIAAMQCLKRQYAIIEAQPDGVRVPGFSQIAFFESCRESLTRLPHIWMRDQTRVGPQTQETFYYGQNIVCGR